MRSISDLSRLATAPAKRLIRKELDRRGLQLVADPFEHRLVRMIDHLGIDTVIDGGANVGQTGLGLRGAGFSGRIVSVEPLTSAYQQLHAVASGDALWSTERAALSDREDSICLNISGNSVSSSVLSMLPAHSDAAPESVYVGTETVPTTTIDALVRRHGIDPARTLLKLDLQGYERVAISGAAETFGAFAAAQLELSFVELYGGQWLAAEVAELMDEHGYQMWMLDPAAMHDPRTGRLLQCDGVFVRR